MKKTANNSDVRPKTSRLSLFWRSGCCILLIFLVTCIGVYFFFVRGVHGEPANTETIQKVTQAFVAALHNNQLDSARGMLSEKIRPTIYTSDLESLSKEEPISTFQNLNVCEFQVIFGASGRRIVGYGLLHYGGSVVIFESALIQDTDSVWRMYSFSLQPNIHSTPSGACKIN